MKRVAMLLAAVLALAVAGRQAGAAEPAPTPPDQTGPSAGAPGAVEAGAMYDPWLDYDDAFRALAEGRRDDARRLIEGIARRAPGHPAAARGATLWRLWPTVAPPSAPTGAASTESELPVDEERPSNGPRAELALFQTLHGIAVGLELCFLSRCNDAGEALGLPLVFSGIGLTASLVATSGGIRAGNVALLDSGTAWGAWNGIAIVVIGKYSEQGVGETLLLTQAAGLGLGGVLAATLHPTAGQVSLASSGGIWSGLLTLYLRGTENFAGGNPSIYKSLVLTSDLGLAGGALLAAGFPVSRGHALLIDVGGIAGSLLGLGAVALIGGDGAHRSTYYKAMIPGALVGLAASAYLTRAWDVPELPVTVTVLPAAEGRGASAVLGGFF